MDPTITTSDSTENQKINESFLHDHDSGSDDELLNYNPFEKKPPANLSTIQSHKAVTTTLNSSSKSLTTNTKNPSKIHEQPQDYAMVDLGVKTTSATNSFPLPTTFSCASSSISYNPSISVRNNPTPPITTTTLSNTTAISHKVGNEDSDSDDELLSYRPFSKKASQSSTSFHPSTIKTDLRVISTHNRSDTINLLDQSLPHSTNSKSTKKSISAKLIIPKVSPKPTLLSSIQSTNKFSLQQTLKADTKPNKYLTHGGLTTSQVEYQGNNPVYVLGESADEKYGIVNDTKMTDNSSSSTKASILLTSPHRDPKSAHKKRKNPSYSMDIAELKSPKSPKSPKMDDDDDDDDDIKMSTVLPSSSFASLNASQSYITTESKSNTSNSSSGSYNLMNTQSTVASKLYIPENMSDSSDDDDDDDDLMNTQSTITTTKKEFDKRPVKSESKLNASNSSLGSYNLMNTQSTVASKLYIPENMSDSSDDDELMNTQSTFITTKKEFDKRPVKSDNLSSSSEDEDAKSDIDSIDSDDDMSDPEPDDSIDVEAVYNQHEAPIEIHDSSDSENDWFASQESNYRQSQQQTKKKKKKPFKINRTNKDHLEPFPLLSNEEKTQVLDEIDTYCIKSHISARPQEHVQADMLDVSDEEGITLQALLYKFISMLLWDFNFRYKLFSHQFVGVLGVAGVDEKKLLGKFVTWDEEKRAMLCNFDNDGKALRISVCKGISFRKGKSGIILGDVMGLGKTVQGIGGCKLRSIIFDVQRSLCNRMSKHQQEKRPMLIIGPNDAVLNQWDDTLILSGVRKDKIKWFSPNDNDIFSTPNDNYILMTRYTLQTEIRNIFKTNERSALFAPWIYNEFKKKKLLNNLRIQYNDKNAKLKKRNTVKLDGETESDCINRLLQENMLPIAKMCFRLTLIDEAHFLRNLSSYWGIGAGLAGLISEWCVPLTGTPYNNSPQDIASLMTYIDPSDRFSKRKRWDKATKGDYDTPKTTDEVIQSCSKWREKNIIRRDKSVLAGKLKKKILRVEYIQFSFSEMNAAYVYYEDNFMRVLDRFSGLREDDAGFEKKNRMKKLFTELMASMTLMRASLIHPVMPGDGREITMKLSPTRNKMLSKVGRKIASQCVCCAKNPTITVRKQDDEKPKSSRRDEEGGSDGAMESSDAEDSDYLSDDESENENNDDEWLKRRQKEIEIKGPLVPVPEYMCDCSKTCRHFIHSKCLEYIESGEAPISICPRCHDLHNRLIRSEGSTKYCSNISLFPKLFPESRGITPSTKIQAIINWFLRVPKGEKAIIYSLFTGSLDILEGIFTHDFGLDIARFDGDLNADQRADNLHRFKTSGDCRLLLTTVQSGGTGLNICEANHAAFVDRWFNPFVHEQAEDRMYRIGQKKDVNITYFDTEVSSDIVISQLNQTKFENAEILLSYDPDQEFGDDNVATKTNSLNYEQLSGKIRSWMKFIINERAQYRSNNPSEDRILSNMKDLLQRLLQMNNSDEDE